MPTLLFPVAGPVIYQDDFGDPRSGGPPHPGNDLLGVKKTPVVAVSLQAFPAGPRPAKPARPAKLTQTVTVATPAPAGVADGDAVTVWTQPAETTLRAMLGADGALTAALVVPAGS